TPGRPRRRRRTRASPRRPTGRRARRRAAAARRPRAVPPAPTARRSGPARSARQAAPGRPAARSGPRCRQSSKRWLTSRAALPAVERVAQPGEEALLAGLELPRRRLLTPQLGQVTQQLLLLGVQPGRGLHGHVDDQVAAPGPVQVLDSRL